MSNRSIDVPEPPSASASDDPAWPYEPDEEAWTTKPTWDCPGGTCACHPPADDEPRHEHVIVFHDPQGKRMTNARCRVYEQGQLVTPEPSKTNAQGELTVEIRASTTTLLVEWAPPDLPRHSSMPYRKRYHVRLGEEAALATDRRLANLGFQGRRRRQDNVRDYQRAYGEAETGNFRDIAAEVAARHDGGQLPMFPPQPLPSAGPDAGSPVHSFLASRSRTALVPDGSAAARAETPPQEGGSTMPAGGQASQGAVVPNVAQVWLIVGLEPASDSLSFGDVTARLRPLQVPGLPESKRDALVKPTDPTIFLEGGNGAYVVFVFRDVPVGTYAALAHIGNVKAAPNGYALGSDEIDVKMGLTTLGYVPARINRPILNVADPLLDLDIPAMQRRRKVLATVFRYFPQSADYQASAKGIAPPYEQGAYKPMYTFVPDKYQNSCAPVNTAIMGLASGAAHLYGTSLLTKHAGFVEYTRGLAPSVGDSLYLIHSNDGTFAHCGIVIESSLTTGEVWLMADGGQPDRTSDLMPDASGEWRRFYNPPPSKEAAFVVPRLFRQDAADPKGATLGNLFIIPISGGGGYGLKGWGDITHPKVPFSKEEYDSNGTEADYRAMKKRALAIPALVRVDRAQCMQKQKQASSGAQKAGP